VPPEPVITFIGMARADNTLVAPTGEMAGISIYERDAGYGFYLVIEARPGGTGAAVGSGAFNPEPGGLPDLQIEVSRDLGNGSPAVCDDTGGVPATVPVDFTPARADAINDLACRFKNAVGQPGGLSPQDACTSFPDGTDHFVEVDSTIQFCAEVDAPFKFPEGDTVVTVRLRDVSGNLSAAAQIIVRVSL